MLHDRCDKCGDPFVGSTELSGSSFEDYGWLCPSCILAIQVDRRNTREINAADRVPLDIKDYRLAPGGEGGQASTWNDKPHRLIYDLCGEVERLRGLLRECAAMAEGE